MSVKHLTNLDNYWFYSNGDKVSGGEAEEMGLILKSVPEDWLDDEVEELVNRMASVPVDQLAMQKMVINGKFGYFDRLPNVSFFDQKSKYFDSYSVIPEVLIKEKYLSSRHALTFSINCLWLS